MKIVTLDIGGTSIKAGEFIDGVLSNIMETDTEAFLGGRHVMDKAKEIIHQYAGFDRIGISTAGQVNSVTGTIRYANSNIPGYTGMEVKKILEKEFGVPVVVENDVNAAAIGEAYYGAGQDFDDFLCLTYGTGVGGAIVMKKKIYTGHQFSAGEFGGIIVHASKRTPEEDIFSGCYEQYASTTALVRNAKELDQTLTDGRIIFDRIEQEEVRQVVDAWITEVAYGLSTLIHIFNPPCIILGGGVMKQKYILDKLRNILYTHIMESYRDVILRQAVLGNTAGMHGVAARAYEIKEN
ncbi:MAG: ROK family protein [Lachnospiraceae bacterium]